jgi:hypothetical protein
MGGRRKYHPGFSVICCYGVFACISGFAEDDIYTFYAATTGVFVMWDQGWHQFLLYRIAGVFEVYMLFRLGGSSLGSGGSIFCRAVDMVWLY